MRSYVDFGDDLYIDYANARPYGVPDMTMAHMHPGYEVLLVLDPVPYSTVIDGKIFRGQGPMAMFIAPYCMHFTYYTDPTITSKKFMAFYVGNGFLESFSDSMFPIKSIIGDYRAKIYNLSGYEDELRGIVQHIVPDFVKGEQVDQRTYKLSTVKQKLLFGVLLNIIKDIRENELTRNVPVGNSYISDVITYIVDNLDKKLNTEDIAEQFYVSRDKLNRDFKKYTQMSIRNFIVESRMNLSKSLLLEKKLNIGDVATSCGFENEKYFYSFFKQNTGLTPKEYSKKYSKKYSKSSGQ